MFYEILGIIGFITLVGIIGGVLVADYFDLEM